ncbi:MAG: hypothetical protein XU08_C0001G0206 [candidate division WWE3 bacterium CSP1-7]|uniref:Uncharacterized protein n=1 Tax=candidate division WWE3 bacterium CSP1-7 TaxID=1576480 RepID=A0A0T5ZYB6_UNCKA|nr:MAG: hypothetical protein XU08_C0001G0206 [candidate division WWE3 bacterium CSP1-7]
MKASKESVKRRLQILKGQLGGLEKMVDEDRYCMDVLTLSLAIQRAMKEMDHLIMEEHMNSCVQEGVRSGKSKEVTKELMDLFEVIRK